MSHRFRLLVVMLVAGLIVQSSVRRSALAQPETPEQPNPPSQDAGASNAASEAAVPQVAPPEVKASPAPANPEMGVAPPSAAGERLGELEAMLGESVVTTASRSAERASTAPSTVYSITSEELYTYGIQSIADALGYLGLGVYTSSARDYSTGIDVGAQGVLLRDAGKHLLALIDGHAMNSQVYGGVSLNEALGVPLEAIDHIEVMLGAGSVLYGSNAMLLVVNVVTRRARDYKGVHVISELGLAAPHRGKNLIGGGSDSRVGLRYRLGASAATTFGEDADLMVSAEWLDDRSNSYGIGPYTGEGYGAIARNEQGSWGGDAYHRMLAPSGVLSARYRDFRLLIQANHYEHGSPMVALFRQRDSLEKQDAFRLDLRHSVDLKTHLTLGSRLYGDYHRFSESTIWPGSGPPPWLQRSASASWLGLEELLTFDWFLDGTASTTLGFDVRGRRTLTDPAEYRADADAPRESGFPSPKRAGGFLGAVFAQQVWKPTRWLTLNGGARLDADTEFSAHVSPRAAVTVEPTDGTSIRGSYSEAFRGPTRFEFDDTDQIYRFPPRSLEPETVRVVELEVQQRLSAITFSVRGFASFYHDFIFSRPATEEELEDARASGQLLETPDPTIVVVVNDNLATIRSYGVSPSVTLRLGRGVNAGATFNYAYSRLGGQPLGVIPSVFGNAHISWQPVPDGVTIAAAAIVAGKRRVVYNDITTPLSVGPQLDLKTTLSGPTGIARLRFRASLTYVHNAYLPYTPLDVTSQPPGEGRIFFPVIARLQGFLGLQYDYAP